jgi:S1-C subfamily serine protease
VNPATLTRLVGKTQIGSEARIVVVRAGDQLELNVAVGERPTFSINRGGIGCLAG